MPTGNTCQTSQLKHLESPFREQRKLSLAGLSFDLKIPNHKAPARSLRWKLLLWKNAIWISVIVTGSRAGTGVYSTGTRSVIYVPSNSDLEPKPCGESVRCDYLVLWCMRKCNSGIQQLWDRTYHSVLWRVRDCIGDGRAGPCIKSMSNEMYFISGSAFTSSPRRLTRHLQSNSRRLGVRCCQPVSYPYEY